MLPAINQKLYLAVVSAVANYSTINPDRLRLMVLQRQMAEAQQAMATEKTLDTWLKAG